MEQNHKTLIVEGTAGSGCWLAGALAVARAANVCTSLIVDVAAHALVETLGLWWLWSDFVGKVSLGSPRSIASLPLVRISEVTYLVKSGLRGDTGEAPPRLPLV